MYVSSRTRRSDGLRIWLWCHRHHLVVLCFVVTFTAFFVSWTTLGLQAVRCYCVPCGFASCCFLRLRFSLTLTMICRLTMRNRSGGFLFPWRLIVTYLKFKISETFGNVLVTKFIFTARIRRMGKIIVSVCLSVHRGIPWPGPDRADGNLAKSR